MRAISLLVIFGTAFGQEGLWQRYMKEADRLEEAGRYKEARVAYQLALQDEETPSKGP